MDNQKYIVAAILYAQDPCVFLVDVCLLVETPMWRETKSDHKLILNVICCKIPYAEGVYQANLFS